MSTQQSSDVTTIKIWSDIACPFCIVGKKNLDTALESLGLGDEAAQKAANVVIEWKSYQLSPENPKTDLKPGKSYYEWLSETKGWPLPNVMNMHQRMKQTGLDAGFEFNFDSIKPSNTRRLHQLIKATQKKNSGQFNVSHQIEEVIFTEYFNKGTSINNIERLAEALQPFNMSVDDIKAAYEDKELGALVDSDIMMARKMGVSGVPFFLINDKAMLSGAQPPQAFQQILKKVVTPSQLEKAKEAGSVQFNMNQTGAVSTGTCRPDGTCD